MPYSMAIAKGIAPAGPAALNTINCCQSAGQSPNNNSPATSMGRANNFTPDSTNTVREGIKTVLDNMTPITKRVTGAVDALIKLSAVLTGAIMERPVRLNPIAKIMVSRTGFLASRLKDTPNVAFLLASKSDDMTKKAKTTAASQATIAKIGILPASP